MNFLLSFFESHGFQDCVYKFRGFPKCKEEWDLVIEFLKRGYIVIYQKNSVIYFMDKHYKGEFFEFTRREDILKQLIPFIESYGENSNIREWTKLKEGDYTRD